MIVVCDTGPLNYLILVGCVEVLPELFGEVLVPAMVLMEMGDQRSPLATRSWAATPPAWLRVQEPSSIDLGLKLDPGEQAAISLAVQVRADRLLIDERLGREAAKKRGLRVVGTLGVLVEAGQRGMIDLRATIDRLRSTSFHVHESVIAEALRSVNERRGQYPGPGANA